MKFSALLNKSESVNVSLLTVISINICLFLTSENVLGIPLILVCIPIYIYLIQKYRANFAQVRFRRYKFMLLPFFILLINISLLLNSSNIYLKNPEYYFWPILSLVSLIPIIVLCFIIYDNKKISFKSSFSICLFFILFGLLSLTSVGRFRFGFGPNTLYRIVIFNFILFAILNRSKLLFYITVPFFLITINSIGSRGGLIALFFVIVYYLLYSLKSKRRLLSYMIPIFSVGCYLVWDKFMVVINSYRLFQINLTENNRTSFYSDFLKWFDQASFVEILFGSGFRSWPFENLYPHNFMLESFHGYGFFVALIIFFLLVVFFITQNKQIILLSIPFVIGASLSGSLYDNITFMGFLFLYYISLDSLRPLKLMASLK